VTAIGCAIRLASATPAAVSIAMPTARFRRQQLTGWVERLQVTAVRIARELELGRGGD